MCEELQIIAQNLNQITLPNTLWTMQIHPEYAHISFLKAGPPGLTLFIEKALILTMNNKILTISFYLNNNLVEIPEFDLTIIDYSSLSRIILFLEELKFCNGGSPTCKHYLSPNSERQVCVSCQDEEEFFMENFFENIAPEKDIFKCSECGIVVENKDQFRKHNMSHQEKVYLCHICGVFFQKRYKIEEHLATHTTEKLYECKICSKKLANSKCLREHKRLHSGVRPYVCSHCGKSFKTRSNLAVHKANHEEVKKNFFCKFCGEAFTFPSILNVHIRKHTGEKPYQCNICQKTFSRNIHLTVHARVHTGEKPYTCSICGKGFATSGNRSTHKRLSHQVKN